MSLNSSCPTADQKIFSIQGLADFLGCSLATAQKIKNSGRIPYLQIGRKVVFECDKVTKALEHPTNN